MANTLQTTIDFIQPYCRYTAANIGINNGPIIGIANVVKNIILAAPFTWNFNRADTTITTVQGTSDYTAALTTLGFVEKASVADGSGNTWQLTDILNEESLVHSVVQARPSALCVYQNTGSSVVWRLSATPDAVYTIYVTYQSLSTQFTSVSNTWAPIPDAFSDVYNNLCLGYYMDAYQDPRGQQYIARGAARLLARSTGLQEMDKAIFAQTYMNFDMNQLLNQLKTQQAVQAHAQA
jgi:hypothetical protein